MDELVEIPFKYSDEIASEVSRIAGKYGDFECIRCADEIVKYLNNYDLPGQKLEMRSVKSNGDFFEGHIVYNDQLISETGYHTAILYNNKVYDNIFSNGISLDEWKLKYCVLEENLILDIKNYDMYIELDWE